MSEYNELDQALPGLKYGIDSAVISGAATAAIAFGAPIYKDVGDAEVLRPFVKDEVIVTYSANFVASNSIAASVNGVAITPVVFATDHATTFAALVTALDGLTGVEVVSSDATTRVFKLRTKGTTLTFTSTVTLGASQATASQQASTSYLLKGAALRSAKGVAGSAQYDITDPVNGMVAGELWVPVADAVSAEKQAYLTAAGVWTDETSGNIKTPFYFRSSTSGAGLARLEVIKVPAST